MTFSITLGWWLVPAIVTVCAFGAFALWEADQKPAGDYGRIGAAMVALIMFGGAVVVALVAWLIYLGLVVALS